MIDPAIRSERQLKEFISLTISESQQFLPAISSQQHTHKHAEPNPHLEGFQDLLERLPGSHVGRVEEPHRAISHQGPDLLSSGSTLQFPQWRQLDLAIWPQRRQWFAAGEVGKNPLAAEELRAEFLHVSIYILYN